jgi:hypothetical protein
VHCCPVKYFTLANKPFILNSVAGIQSKNDLNLKTAKWAVWAGPRINGTMVDE